MGLVMLAGNAIPFPAVTPELPKVTTTEPRFCTRAPWEPSEQILTALAATLTAPPTMGTVSYPGR